MCVAYTIATNWELYTHKPDYGLHVPTVTSDVMNGSFDNILVAHPIGYSKLVSEQSTSTIETTTSSYHYIDFTF